MRIAAKALTRLWVLCFCSIAAVPVFAAPYPQLTADIAWSPGNFNTVADIAAAFGNARAAENTQLSTSIPTTLTMPLQAVWNAWSGNQKGLYLINAERVARGLLPFESVSNHIVSIAVSYSELLLSTNQFSHNDGSTPSSRLDSDPAIAGCSEGGYIYGPECLALFVQSSGTVPMPVERAIYGWIYANLSSSWADRNACFALLTNDFLLPSSEGFIGIGYTIGPYTIGTTRWNSAALIVFDFVDPCPTSTLTEDQPLVIHTFPQIFLQGPFVAAGDSMPNLLRKSGVLTTKFPGAVIPARAVDSINIEIRDSATAAKATIRLFSPAWLLTDGTVCSFTDTTLPYVTFTAPEWFYHIVVHHRNHLSVMSKDSLNIGIIPNYDFTTGQTRAYGSNALVQVGTKFCLIAGDADGSGDVTILDRAAWRSQNSQSGYLGADMNLSGDVTILDRALWRANNSLSSQVP